MTLGDDDTQSRSKGAAATATASTPSPRKKKEKPVVTFLELLHDAVGFNPETYTYSIGNTQLTIYLSHTQIYFVFIHIRVYVDLLIEKATLSWPDIDTEAIQNTDSLDTLKTQIRELSDSMYTATVYINSYHHKLGLYYRQILYLFSNGNLPPHIHQRNYVRYIIEERIGHRAGRNITRYWIESHIQFAELVLASDMYVLKLERDFSWFANRLRKPDDRGTLRSSASCFSGDMKIARERSKLRSHDLDDTRKHLKHQEPL